MLYSQVMLDDCFCLSQTDCERHTKYELTQLLIFHLHNRPADIKYYDKRLKRECIGTHFAMLLGRCNLVDLCLSPHWICTCMAVWQKNCNHCGWDESNADCSSQAAASTRFQMTWWWAWSSARPICQGSMNSSQIRSVNTVHMSRELYSTTLLSYDRYIFRQSIGYAVAHWVIGAVKFQLWQRNDS